MLRVRVGEQERHRDRANPVSLDSRRGRRHIVVDQRLELGAGIVEPAADLDYVGERDERLRLPVLDLVHLQPMPARNVVDVARSARYE